MKVRARIHVRSADGRNAAVLVPGDTVPEWATVTNPDALDDGDAEPDKAPDETPEVEHADTPEPAKRAPRRRKPVSHDE